MIYGYIVKVGKKVVGDDELKVLFDILEKSNVKKSITFLNDSYVIYYKEVENGASVMIKSDRKNIGALRFYEKTLIKKVKRFKFDSLNEIFDLAEEIKDMSIEEFVKFVRREV
jgi:hypothetical protein